MQEKKTIGAGKQENQPQDKSDNERLSDDDLDNVAGGSDDFFLQGDGDVISYGGTTGK